MKVDKIDLIKLPIMAEFILDDYPVIKHELKLEQIIDPMLKGMLYQIRTYILAEEIERRSKIVSISLTFPVYKNWWEHFRGQVFPDWLKKRFPPQFNYVTNTGKKEVTFRKYATYPRANILFPKETGTLIKFKSFIDEKDE